MDRHGDHALVTNTGLRMKISVQISTTELTWLISWYLVTCQYDFSVTYDNHTIYYYNSCYAMLSFFTQLSLQSENQFRRWKYPNKIFTFFSRNWGEKLLITDVPK